MGQLGRVELRQLRHFVAVVEAGGISAAARRLNLTQSALSRQIKALEESLGVCLLDRGARSFALTPAAETLLADARKLLDFQAGMTARVRAAATGLPLRIGYPPSLAGDFLPLAIERFTQLHPGVRVSLHDATSLEMQQMLLAGKLDLMVSVPCGQADAMTWTILRECGWRLAANRRHRLAGLEVITPADLDGAEILLFDRGQYPDYWNQLSAFFKAHDIRARLAGELDGITSLLAAVEANLGCAIIADTSRLPREDDPRMVTRPISPPPEPITVAAGVNARHPAPPHVLSFIEEMKLHVSA
jgi:DNA-binding transcriptional LysR family regulator